jgi:hypothetical protein
VEAELLRLSSRADRITYLAADIIIGLEKIATVVKTNVALKAADDLEKVRMKEAEKARSSRADTPSNREKKRGRASTSPRLCKICGNDLKKGQCAETCVGRIAALKRIEKKKAKQEALKAKKAAEKAKRESDAARTSDENATSNTTIVE